MGNGLVILPHISIDIWLLIHFVVKVNPCQLGGPDDHGVSRVSSFVINTCRHTPCLVFDAPIFHELSAIADFQNIWHYCDQYVSNANMSFANTESMQHLLATITVTISQNCTIASTLIVGTMSPWCSSGLTISELIMLRSLAHKTRYIIILCLATA